jgi:hypothetical protein
LQLKEHCPTLKIMWSQLTLSSVSPFLDGETIGRHI